MKSILLLTDFSANSFHAARNAARLSEMLHADLLLYNSYLSKPLLNYIVDGGWPSYQLQQWERESYDRLYFLADDLQPLIEHLNKDTSMPKVHTHAGFGNLVSNIQDIAKSHNLIMIVMGQSLGGFIDHTLFGSDTISVIDHASCPILVVPITREVTDLGPVVFATDCNMKDLKVINYLVNYCELQGLQLEVIHVLPFGKKEDLEKASKFIRKIGMIKYPKLTYKRLCGKDIAGRINNYCKTAHTGLFAIVHMKHSLFARLLHQSITNKSLHVQELPVMIFPAKMNW